MILMINDRFYNEQEIRQLIQSQADELKDLKEENKVLISECDRLIKEKGKLLKKADQLKKKCYCRRAAILMISAITVLLSAVITCIMPGRVTAAHLTQTVMSASGYLSRRRWS